MKRLSMLLLLVVAAGCAKSGAAPTKHDDRPLVICSTTQIADFARQVVGDRMDVSSILSAGADPHLYKITPGDAKLVATADLCLENGLHLEGNDWMRTLAVKAEKELVTCTKGIKPLELDEDGQKVADPHSWFSTANARVYVRNILEAVCQLDEEHANEYRARAELYNQQLDALHGWIEHQFSAIPPAQRVLVTSHDAFNYFCDAYGFTASAPVGWSTGSEIGGGLTPERRKKVVESIRDAGVKAIFVETSVNPKLIREIAEEAGVTIGGELYSDSMGAPGTGGETYIGMMRENVLTITGALVGNKS